MNKDQILVVLECCLLTCDQVSEQEMIAQYGFNPVLVRAGINLYLFLKSKEVAGKFQ